MAEPEWLPPCRDAVISLGGKLCSEAHCDTRSIQDYTHAFCSCTYPLEYG